MRLPIVLLLVLSCAGCTITVKPLPQPRKHIYHPTRHRMHPRETTRPSPAVVDSDWLIQYKQLEQEHGDYKISDDTKVESVGGGQYRVTPAMLRHFRDLSQTPVSSPTPTP